MLLTILLLLASFPQMKKSFIYCILFGKKLRNYLDENWRTVRCYPHIIPIAGFGAALITAF